MPHGLRQHTVHVVQVQLALALSAREQGLRLLQGDQHVFLQLGMSGEVQLGHGQDAAGLQLLESREARPTTVHVGGQTGHGLSRLA